MSLISAEHRFTFRELFDTPYEMELLSWRNQDFVRANMIDDRPISPENHLRYLEKLRRGGTQKVYIAFFDDRPAAVLTFRYEENLIEPGSYIIRHEDLSKGFGAVIGYARLEYIFRKMPQGKAMTVILEHNRKNISNHRSFGYVNEGTKVITKSDGSEETALIFTMTGDRWKEQRPKIESLLTKLIPLENIGTIG